MARQERRRRVGGRRGPRFSLGLAQAQFVVQLAARGQLNGPRGRGDAGGAVHHQSDALTEERAVVRGGLAGAGRKLVQPESFDELRARVDQSDVNVGA